MLIYQGVYSVCRCFVNLDEFLVSKHVFPHGDRFVRAGWLRWLPDDGMLSCEMCE